SDPSQVPTAIVCGVARDHVTVCLSGDGGDEVFGGYNRYLFGRLAWERAGRLPLWARQAAARALAVLGPRQWDALVSAAGPLTPRHLRVRNAGEKVQKLASVLGASSPAEVYGALVTQWASPARLIGLDAEPVTELTGRDGWPALPEITEQMMFADTVVSLPDDMLTKVDRASMSVGLEARVPLLDHRLVEFAWRLPPEWKVGPRQGKHLLRQVLYRHVPAGLIERPKLGFDPPIGTWLRGPLRAWAEDLLGHRALEESFDDPGPIHRAWSEHLAGRQNHDYRLWGVLMFEAWRRSVGV
ncbi:MAG: asparagine synthetase B family protein, partial [Acidimicrobiales bacterium]